MKGPLRRVFRTRRDSIERLTGQLTLAMTMLMMATCCQGNTCNHAYPLLEGGEVSNTKMYEQRNYQHCQVQITSQMSQT